MEKWEAQEGYRDHDGERGKITVTAKVVSEEYTQYPVAHPILRISDLVEPVLEFEDERGRRWRRGGGRGLIADIAIDSDIVVIGNGAIDVIAAADGIMSLLGEMIGFVDGCVGILSLSGAEFGYDVGRVKGLPLFQRVCDDKTTISKVIEEAGIPHSFVSANCFGA
ncbi:uncharacterized protein LOC131856612 [Cryptomeria japonica]|uniref:uncharacterized protein LOC131856612 n=1 Tax=Cryptomeria japonica TaxID=3369 RepID=UPI0027DA44D3|nr:uncharacterized protein LOC131856612 [Cryptomeria japonica]